MTSQSLKCMESSPFMSIVISFEHERLPNVTDKRLLAYFKVYLGEKWSKVAIEYTICETLRELELLSVHLYSNRGLFHLRHYILVIEKWQNKFHIETPAYSQPSFN